MRLTPQHLLAHGDRSRLILCASSADRPLLLKATRITASDTQRGDGVTTAATRLTASAIERLQREIATLSSGRTLADCKAELSELMKKVNAIRPHVV